MANKTFYIDLQKQNFNQTKIINNEIYFNHILRKSRRNDPIKLFDNHSVVSNVSINKKLKKGHPLHLKKFKIRHPFEKIIQFEIHTPNNSPKESSFRFYFNLIKNLTNIHKKYPVMVLANAKGGYMGYIPGILGFIPKSQYKLSRKLFFSRYFNSLKKNLTSIYYKQKLTLPNTNKGFFNIIPNRLPFILTNKKLTLHGWGNSFLKSYSKFQKSLFRSVFVLDYEQVLIHKKKLQDFAEKLKKKHEQKQLYQKQIKQKDFRIFKSNSIIKPKLHNNNHIIKSQHSNKTIPIKNNKTSSFNRKK